jgi:MoaA/NifB/PqqE/SkfB family radical SAM enzyme/SAM-dependent methyltransferase
MESSKTPIYLKKDSSDWFVPNKAADDILNALLQGKKVGDSLDLQKLLNRFQDAPQEAYQGRAAFLAPDHLRELWFHLTNNCNLTCAHCMFKSSPMSRLELKTEDVLRLADEAAALGCRVFAFTGGEPFAHKDISKIIDHILGYQDSHVVVLTNGTLIHQFIDAIKRWPADRFFLQVSVDGTRENHDRIRGDGAFVKLSDELSLLKSIGAPPTLSMAVENRNVKDMPALIEYAARVGAPNVHYMWYFIRGRGASDGFADVDRIFEQLILAAKKAEELGIIIDNIDSLKTQVFAPKGTIHDGTGSGWDSAAIGPDGRLFPSAALVGIDELATDISCGLAKVWKDNDTFKELREASIKDDFSSLKFLLGGGDSDHSYMRSGQFIGQDPYLPLYEKAALWLIAKHAKPHSESVPPRLRLKMGEILESCGAHGGIALVHTNCLLAVAGQDSRTVVKEFYSKAAKSTKEDIVNPVCLPDEYIRHIPKKFRMRSYGCGSPVIDAEIQPGYRVVDLGSGTGVECFVAAKLVGPEGFVTGVDMLDPMLEIARQGSDAVAKSLGYRNLEFKKGYLEQLPLEDACADEVMSNCVINLSANKRDTFAEVFRVLRPGGKLVVSDVVCETEPGPAIRNDEMLQGECIGGAMTQRDLMGILDETGFVSTKVLKLFAYRIVNGHPFFSITFEARKPGAAHKIKALYRGPFPYVLTAGGQMLQAGVPSEIPASDLPDAADDIFELDEDGNVVNVEMADSCCCSSDPKPVAPSDSSGDEVRHRSGCMVCGETLQYLETHLESKCVFCGLKKPANALCQKGHFVCDACHCEDAVSVITSICASTTETDMIALMARIRSHPSMPIHGPEHHAMIPGIILSTYRNLGGEITLDQIREGIRRGALLPGGICAFQGACGGALGAGVALSLLLKANPIKARERTTVQSATNAILGEISSFEAGRCCQRDCWIALTKAAELSRKLLPIPLKADHVLTCRQMRDNAECIGKECPLWAPHSSLGESA